MRTNQLRALFSLQSLLCGKTSPHGTQRWAERRRVEGGGDEEGGGKEDGTVSEVSWRREKMGNEVIRTPRHKLVRTVRETGAFVERRIVSARQRLRSVAREGVLRAGVALLLRLVGAVEVGTLGDALVLLEDVVFTRDFFDAARLLVVDGVGGVAVVDDVEGVSERGREVIEKEWQRWDEAGRKSSRRWQGRKGKTRKS
jgi:hypothetical protein